MILHLGYLLRSLLPSFLSPLALTKNSSTQDASEGVLMVEDSRTGRFYKIPITHNAVRAIDFKAISTSALRSNPVDQVDRGLRIVDPGFQNTAVMESQVTYV